MNWFFTNNTLLLVRILFVFLFDDFGNPHIFDPTLAVVVPVVDFDVGSHEDPWNFFVELVVLNEHSNIL